MLADSEVTDTQTPATEEVENTSPSEETVVDTETEAQETPEHSEYEQKMFKRAKEAEAEAKALKNKLKELETAKPASPELSTRDVVALATSGIHTDDIEEVMDYAKFKNLSVMEALKSGYIKTALREREEERKSAQVANSGSSKRPSTKLTDEQVLARVEKGEEPKTDEEWIQLHRARRALKK